MKHTEKVNIGGYSFNIEDDAYKSLEDYLESIRKAYSNDAGCGEICNDIEERIAELLLERCSGERVVSTDMIQRVRQIIGEFGEEKTEENGTQTSTEETKPGRKRLFRDLENKYVGGVFSGLAAYLDVDVVIFRLAFTVLVVAGYVFNHHWSNNISTILIVAYVIMLICIPAAKTVEQKCQLSGKPLSSDDFNRRPNNVAGEFRSAVNEVRTSPGMHLIGRIILIFIGIILFLSGLGMLCGCAVVNFIPDIVRSFVDDAEVIMIVNTLFSTSVCASTFVFVGLCAIGMIYGGIMLIFNLNAPKWRPGLVIFIAAVIALFVMGFFATQAIVSIPNILN